MHELVWWIMGLGLVAYVLSGGADFGAGLWHLFASGPRKAEQRSALAHAIAPIWEANHVWLIFVVVLMFTAYPRAFAVVATSFHVPLAIALVGIVLRGASFVFRAYGLGDDAARERWGTVFAWASCVTPIALGAVLAGASSGAVTLRGDVVSSGFLAGWTTPFALLTGLFALALFALLAAMHMVADGPGEVRSDFRARALAAELISAVLAAAVYASSRSDAALLHDRLATHPSFWPIQVLTALAALAAVVGLWRRRDVWARAFACLQVILVIVGWGTAMRGYVVLDAVPESAAGARMETIQPVLWALAIGGVLLLPSLAYLFRVFRASSSRAARGGDASRS